MRGETSVASPQFKAEARTTAILSGPLTPLLIGMSAPNIVAMVIQIISNFAEIWYVGQLGTVALAAIAIVFPIFMLMMMLAGGAIGGAISAAVARAVGSNRIEHAERLVWNALLIACVLGAVYSAVFLIWGEAIFRMLGAEGAVVADALAYSDIMFSGAVIFWIFNALGSILRGSGDMKSPAIAMLGLTVVQIPLSGALIFGWGPFPEMRIAGVPASALICGSLASFYLFGRLCSHRSRVQIKLSAAQIQLDALWDILRVGLLASASPLFSVLTIVLLTALVAGYSTEALAGYGIGTRLEFLIIPITWGIGVALTAIVGTNLGAGQIDRAHAAAWRGAAASFCIAGGLGLLVAIFPEIWVSWFTDDPAVYATAARYLNIAGPFYALQGVGLCLYFASQGAGAVFWPVAAGAGRMAVSVIGGWAWIVYVDSSIEGIFGAIAAGMATYGICIALSVYLGAWRHAYARHLKRP